MPRRCLFSLLCLHCVSFHIRVERAHTQKIILFAFRCVIRPDLSVVTMDSQQQQQQQEEEEQQPPSESPGSLPTFGISMSLTMDSPDEKVDGPDELQQQQQQQQQDEQQHEQEWDTIQQNPRQDKSSMMEPDTVNDQHTNTPAISNAMTEEKETNSLVDLVSDETAVTDEQGREAIMGHAIRWLQEVETIRDDMTMMSVQNAILLDSLTMAGADI